MIDYEQQSLPPSGCPGLFGPNTTGNPASIIPRLAMPPLTEQGGQCASENQEGHEANKGQADEHGD